MKKKLTILLSLVFVLLFAVGGCASIVEIKEGKYFSYSVWDDGTCRVRELTDEGEALKQLYIPAFIDGCPVVEVGETEFSEKYWLQSDVIEYLNYPYTVQQFNDFTGITKLKILVICRTEPIIFRNPVSISFYIEKPMIYVPKGYAAAYNEKQKKGMKYYEANISLMFNYEGAPNDGFYSVDYKTPSQKVVKPADPIREGYTFGGWFKDAECQTEWDFDSVIEVADLTLYAGWTQI